jgi:hypothetical protein
MLRCSDIMPGDFYREVVDRFDLDERSCRQTCGSVARVLLDELNAKTTAV